MKRNLLIFSAIFVGCLIAQQISVRNIRPDEKRGSGNLIQLGSGSVTNNHLAKFDSSGNLIDAGIITGPSGPQGLTGATGPSGPSGASGTSSFTGGLGITVSGSVISTDVSTTPRFFYAGTLPATCLPGRDWYVDTATGRAYNCGASNIWFALAMPLPVVVPSSGSLILTTSYQDVPGATLTLPANQHISYGVKLDLSAIVVSQEVSPGVNDIGTRVSVIFNTNGVNSIEEAVFYIDSILCGGSVSVSASRLMAAGQVVKIQAKKSGGLGASNIERAFLTISYVQ